jgi:hypothetical protein
MKVKKIFPDGADKYYYDFLCYSIEEALVLLENSKEIVDFIDTVLVQDGYSVDISIVDNSTNIVVWATLFNEETTREVF